MAGFWVNYICDRTIPKALAAQWQVPLGLQLLPGVLLLLGILWCPETPRWHAKQDRWDKAREILADIRNLPPDHPFIQEELQDVQDQISISRLPPGEHHTVKYYARRMWQKGTRNRIGIGLLLMAFQNLTGMFHPFITTVSGNLADDWLQASTSSPSA